MSSLESYTKDFYPCTICTIALWSLGWGARLAPRSAPLRSLLSMAMRPWLPWLLVSGPCVVWWGGRGPAALTKKIASSRRSELFSLINEALEAKCFNAIHAAAAYHRLARLQKAQSLKAPKKSALSRSESPVLLRLAERLKDLPLTARIAANIFWAIANLKEFPSVRALAPSISEAVAEKVKEMKPQELANSLWATAQLKDLPVLQAVPALVAEIQLKAGSMKPQELSNCLWAAANLKDLTPEVLELVPFVAKEIPLQKNTMKSQDLANNLWAVATLKTSLELVPFLAEGITRKVRSVDFLPQHFSNSLWSAAQLKHLAPEVLSAVPALSAQLPRCAAEMTGDDVALSMWSATQLDRVAPEVLHMLPSVVHTVFLRSKLNATGPKTAKEMK